MSYLYSKQLTDYGTTNYYAVPERPDDEPELYRNTPAPTAQVSISDAYEKQVVNPDVKRTDWDVHTDDELAIGIPEFERFYGEGSPEVAEQRARPQMFLHRPERISGVVRDPDVSPAALSTLLGVALVNHPKAVADSALSESGSRLAKKGVMSGVINPNPANPSMSSNISGWEPVTRLGRDAEGGHVWGTTPLSEEEVAKGRKKIRSAITGETPEPEARPTLGPQFQQQTLF